MRRIRFPFVLVLVLGLLAACTQLSEPLPQLDAMSVREDARVIVVLNDSPSIARADQNRAAAASVARAYGLSPSHTYGAALVGFAAHVPAGRLAALQNDPRVAYVEPDGIVEIFAQETPTGVKRIFAEGNANLDIDGADDVRIDVDVAVIDTGVDFDHPDLNVVGGVNCAGGGPFRSNCTSGGDDDHYHGTHVAGTIAAIDDGSGVVGVAPGARIWAVKVLDSSGRGYQSWIVAGIDWVTANASEIEVANMSLGGSGYSQAEYDAIQSAVNAGVAFAVAAGNSDDDASNYSPAAFDNVLTVSALADFNGSAGGGAAPTCRTDQDDTLADFSNWGSVVDIAAPGVCILSTYPLEQGEYGTISGTSMASPHAAGALALLASSANPGNAADVHALYDKVIAAGNLVWTDDSGDGTKERLLDVSSTTVFAPKTVPGSGGGGDDGGGGDGNASPVAVFTYTCIDLACSFDGSDSTDDVSIESYAWDFGDGATATGPTANHAYAGGGTFIVTLTVTDGAFSTDTSSQSVTVTEPSTSGISLSATGYKVRGRQHVDLEWTGRSTGNVDVKRDGTTVGTIANDSSGTTTYTDSIGKNGGGTYTYQVCDEGTATCSNMVTVTF